MLITAFVGIGAYYGSWYLIAGPADSELPYSAPAFLPGDGWSAGGWALLLLVAVPMTVTAVAAVARPAVAAEAAIGAGALLIGWIVVQVSVIGLVFFLQPLMFVIGGIIVALGIRGRR